MANAAAGFAASFTIAVLTGGWIIRALQALGARQTVSSDAPARHSEKQGTPTMGGLIILLGLSAPVIFYAMLQPIRLTALPLIGLTLSYGLIGFLDDYLIATRGKNLGLKARQKLALQFIFAAGFVGWLYYTAVPERTTVVRLWNELDLGWVYYAAGVLFIVALSNAVNFMDGLDGLAAGVCSMIALGLAATVYAGSGYAWLPLFGGALSGACAGFLWYNAHPALVFMGDTGSLAMGAAIAGMAMMGKAEGAVQVFSVIPWCALFSVIIQVAFFKYRARRYGLEYAKTHRVFKRTPIHHHFEELGWPETRIVSRFWLVTALVIGVMIALGAGR